MSFIQLWFAGTVAMVLGFLIWNYAPILVPLLAVTAGLGLVSGIIVAIARRFRPPEPPEV